MVIPVAIAPVTKGPAFTSALSSSNALSAANTEVAFTAKAAGAALVEEAGAAQVLGAASRRSTAEVKTAIAAQEQFRRGILASLLSLLGIRGATLAAGTQFLIGAAAITVLAKSVQGAVEDEEALADATQILGESLGQKLDKQAQKLAISLGIVDEQIVRFESSLALIFKNVNLTDEATLQYSKTLLELARNISSVKDIPVADAFKAIQSALLGNLRGLRQLGIGLDAATIRQRALRDSGKELASDLTQQEIVQARYALLLEKTTRFSGAWADEQERLSGKTQVLAANIDQLADSIGSNLVPFLNDAVSAANLLFAVAGKLERLRGPRQVGDDAQQASGKMSLLDQAVNNITSSLGLLIKPGAAAHRILVNLGIAAEDAADSASDAVTGFDKLAQVLVDLGDSALSLSQAGAVTPRSLGEGLTGVVEGITEGIDAAGIVSPAQQISQLQARIKANQAVIDAANKQIALGVGNTKELVETRRKAQAQIASDQRTIKGIEDQQASDAKAASDAAARAADEAKRAADQRIQDQIDQQQNQAQIKLINAEAAKGLEDDIKAQIAIRNLIQKQIRVLVPQIQDVRLRNQVLQALTLAEAQAKAAVTALFKQRNDNREAAKDAARAAAIQADENKVESADLSIQLAQINENIAKEIAAHKLKIKRLIDLRKNFKQGTNEYKRITVEIAAEQKAIDDLNNKTKKASGAANDFFEFLQKQQGFAVSLLGNLFPGGVASGALGVGATRGAAAGATSDLFPQGAGPGFAGDVTGALSDHGQVQSARDDLKATKVQQQTTNHILRQILRVLQHQGRAAADPEARFNRASGSAVMDIM